MYVRMQIRVGWSSDPLPNFEISVPKLYRANPLISGVKLDMTPWAIGLPTGFRIASSSYVHLSRRIQLSHRCPTQWGALGETGEVNDSEPDPAAAAVCRIAVAEVGSSMPDSMTPGDRRREDHGTFQVTMAWILSSSPRKRTWWPSCCRFDMSGEKKGGFIISSYIQV